MLELLAPRMCVTLSERYATFALLSTKADLFQLTDVYLELQAVFRRGKGLGEHDSTTVWLNVAEEFPQLAALF